jgi:hypothetical protein
VWFWRIVEKWKWDMFWLTQLWIEVVAGCVGGGTRRMKERERRGQWLEENGVGGGKEWGKIKCWEPMIKLRSNGQKSIWPWWTKTSLDQAKCQTEPRKGCIKVDFDSHMVRSVSSPHTRYYQQGVLCSNLRKYRFICNKFKKIYK